MMREKPKTQKETIDQLWYTMIGTNGDGVIDRLARVEERVSENGSKKPPKRLEVLTAVILGLTFLNASGWIDLLREAVFSWLKSGG